MFLNLENIKKMKEERERIQTGLTLVMGSPFQDNSFIQFLESTQQEINNIFNKHNLSNSLFLYNTDNIHSTLVGLEGKKQKNKNFSEKLTKQDLEINLVSGKKMNLDYILEFTKTQKPFEIKLGKPDCCQLENIHTITINNQGLIILLGHPKERGILSNARKMFNINANIKHKCENDSFFCTIGYLKPDINLFENKNFNLEMQEYINKKRQETNFSTYISKLKLIYYANTTLKKDMRLKQINLELEKEPEIKENLIDYII